MGNVALFIPRGSNNMDTIKERTKVLRETEHRLLEDSAHSLPSAVPKYMPWRLSMNEYTPKGFKSWWEYRKWQYACDIAKAVIAFGSLVGLCMWAGD